MSLFFYKAIDSYGRKTQGEVNAFDSGAAAALLREESLFILELTEKNAVGRSFFLFKSGRYMLDFTHFWRRFLPVTKRDIIFFFRQLALMRRTGLTLLPSLEICRDQSTKLYLKRVIDKLIDAVQSGSSFSEALAGSKRYIPEIAIKMIITAEVTGELSEILDQIAIQMERTEELTNTILTSLMYPAFIVIIMIAVIIFLVTTVVPKFTVFLAQKDVVLPPSTQLLMDIYAFLSMYKLRLLAGFGFTAVVTIFGYLLPKGRLAIDRFFLALPVMGGILSMAYMAYFARTMSVLLRSGVSLLESIHVLSGSIPNRVISRHLEVVENEILKGGSFSKVLRANIIPSLVTEIINVGEVTGSLEQVLGEIGAFYEKNLQRRIKWMTTLFEPAVILLVGGVVGFVYFAFFQVLFQLARI